MDRTLQAEMWARTAEKSKHQGLFRRNIIEQEKTLSQTVRKHIAGKHLLREHPDWTDADIGRLVGLTSSAIGKYRHYLVGIGVISYAVIRTDSQGEVFGNLRPQENVSLIVQQHREILQNAIVPYFVSGPLPEEECPAQKVLRRYKSKGQKTSVRAAQNVFNFVACKLYPYVTWKDFPWQGLVSANIAEGLVGEMITRGFKPNTIGSYWGYLVGTDKSPGVMRQNYLDERITQQEWGRIVAVGKPIVVSDSVRKAPVFSPEDWLKIANTLDLNDPADFMHLAYLCLIFPMGLRPSGALGVNKSSLETIDLGYIRFKRQKTRHHTSEYGAMVDYCPTVRTILKTWASMVPEESNYLFYKTANVGGHIYFDRPWDDPSTHGHRSARWLSVLGKEILDDEFMPKSGRSSYNTYCRNIRLQEEWVALNCGHKYKGQSAGWEYFEKNIEPLRGYFKQVPEFQVFDRGLEEIFFRHALNAELPEVEEIEVEDKYIKCACPCMEYFLRKGKKRYIDGNHRKNAFDAHKRGEIWETSLYG